MEAVLDFYVKAGDETLESGAGRPSLDRPAWPCLHVSPPSCGPVLIAFGGRSFRRFDQPTPFWAGRPTSGGLSVLRCSDTFLSGHGSILDRVDVACLTMAEVGLSFGYGFKPSGSKLCISGSNPFEMA